MFLLKTVWTSLYQFMVPVQTILESRVHLLFFIATDSINTVSCPSDFSSGSIKFCWIPVFSTFDSLLYIHDHPHIWLVPFNSPTGEQITQPFLESYSKYMFSDTISFCVNAKFRLSKKVSTYFCSYLKWRDILCFISSFSHKSSHKVCRSLRMRTWSRVHQHIPGKSF